MLKIPGYSIIKKLRNKMAAKIKFPPGTYWFSGYDDEDSTYPHVETVEERREMFRRFLEKLPVDNPGYCYDTGETGSILGVFRFQVSPVLEMSDLDWVDAASDECLMESLKETATELSYRYPEDIKYIKREVDMNNLDSGAYILVLKPGPTICDSSCRFYNVCSGDRDDKIFNPSYMFDRDINCKTHDFGGGGLYK